MTGVSSDENGNEEAEPTDSDDDGELKDQVGLDIKITDADETTYYLEEGGTISTSSSAGYETATKYEGDEWGDSTASNDVINPFSGPATFTIDAKFFDETNNNAAQGDSLKVDFKFVLEQR